MKSYFYLIAVVALVGFTLVSCSPPCNDFAGTYSGSSTMGYTTGSAKITINEDCTALLVYSQNSFGGDRETGEIYKEGSDYKFKSTNGGGTYDLTISDNKIVLNGFNWECVMTR